MKNRRGFTLIEVLCVITILGIIIVIAIPSILNLKDDNQVYCAKLELIKIQANNYALSHEQELNNSSETYNNYPALKITVQDLLDSSYLEPDKDNIILNPKDNTSLNNQEIIIYLKNNTINIYIDSNNIC